MSVTLCKSNKFYKLNNHLVDTEVRGLLKKLMADNAY